MRRMCILQKIQQRLQRGLRGQGNGGRTDKDLALHVSWISILVNVALTIGKLSAGILAHSNAIGCGPFRIGCVQYTDRNGRSDYGGKTVG